MNISQAIVFGSNFGLRSHLRSLKKFKNIKKLYIHSTTIKKKKVPYIYIPYIIILPYTSLPLTKVAFGNPVSCSEKLLEVAFFFH